ncbi:MAG: DUF2637 domain-containing protein [Dactylosporangium sp.]|nr:DUF2637 domain-containing protein [Dactylosporangium sp.]NNJ59551.1 DUF2637 domain-containing protein [Dactylosporangium sp.]
MTTPTSIRSANAGSAITPASLRRLRWAVRATLILGVAVSVTANVLHARTEPIAQAIAAWPPLALLITVDLVSRVPIHRKLLGGVRITATFAIAVIAAFISYGHMAAVALKYGEIGIVPYLLPLSVDGMIIVASISLVELGGRMRETTPALSTAATHRPGAPADRMSGTGLGESPPVRVGVTDGDHLSGSDPTGAVEHAAGDRNDHPDDVASERYRPIVAPPDLPADLVPLMEAARKAGDELHDEGTTISRDALAARLRRNGHPLRTSRVTELLAALKAEGTPANGHRPRSPR